MINVQEKTMTLSVYTTNDGAMFKDKEQANEHESVINMANIVCNQNKVRFYDDNFEIIPIHYEGKPELFYNEDDEEYEEYEEINCNNIRHTFGRAAYYYCADNEALEAIEYFGSTRFGFSCYDNVIIGYCSLLNDDAPIDMLQEFNEKRLALMKMGYCFETNS